MSKASETPASVKRGFGGISSPWHQIQVVGVCESVCGLGEPRTLPQGQSASRSVCLAQRGQCGQGQEEAELVVASVSGDGWVVGKRRRRAARRAPVAAGTLSRGSYKCTRSRRGCC